MKNDKRNNLGIRFDFLFELEHFQKNFVLARTFSKTFVLHFVLFTSREPILTIDISF